MVDTFVKLKNLSPSEKGSFFFCGKNKAFEAFFTPDLQIVDSWRNRCHSHIHWRHWNIVCNKFDVKDLSPLPKKAYVFASCEAEDFFLLRALRILLTSEKTVKTFKDFL